MILVDAWKAERGRLIPTKEWREDRFAELDRLIATMPKDPRGGARRGRKVGTKLDRQAHKERLERVAARMREKYLHTGSGCASAAKAIKGRLA